MTFNIKDFNVVQGPTYKYVTRFWIPRWFRDMVFKSWCHKIFFKPPILVDRGDA